MPRSLWIHVKFATLRDGWFVGGQIYVLDQLHGLEGFVWNEIQRHSASHRAVLGELLEDVLELGELEEQLDEQVEDSLGLGESVLGLGESGRKVLSFLLVEL